MTEIQEKPKIIREGRRNMEKNQMTDVGNFRSGISG